MRGEGEKGWKSERRRSPNENLPLGAYTTEFESKYRPGLQAQ